MLNTAHAEPIIHYLLPLLHATIVAWHPMRTPHALCSAISHPENLLPLYTAKCLHTSTPPCFSGAFYLATRCLEHDDGRIPTSPSTTGSMALATVCDWSFIHHREPHLEKASEQQESQDQRQSRAQGVTSGQACYYLAFTWVLILCLVHCVLCMVVTLAWTLRPVRHAVMTSHVVPA